MATALALVESAYDEGKKVGCHHWPAYVVRHF